MRALARQWGAGAEWTPEQRRTQAARWLRELAGYSEQLQLARLLAAGTSQIVIHGTRRSGKTTALARTLLARLVARDNYVVRVMTTHLLAPTRTLLDNPSDPFTMLQTLDAAKMARPTVTRRRTTNGALIQLRFMWGSELVVHEAAHQSALDKARGLTANIWVIDEAQSHPLVANALTQIIKPTAADREGSVILSGTPSRDTDGAFRAAIVNPAWKSIHLRSWDNPNFGATPRERWERIHRHVIEVARVEYGLSESDSARLLALDPEQLTSIALGREESAMRPWLDTLSPDFLREILGRWVVGREEFPYAAATMLVETLCWCRAGHTTPGAQPVLATLPARLASLPTLPPGERWQIEIGLDIGWVSPSAWVFLAWSRHHPVIYEVWSEKHAGWDDEEIFEHTVKLIRLCMSAGARVTEVVADVGGTRIGTGKAWERHMQGRLDLALPLRPPIKHDARKVIKIRSVNLDTRRGELLLVAGGELLFELQHLRFKPGTDEIDEDRDIVIAGGETIRPGDHCADALLYAHQGILSGRAEKAPPPVPTAQELMERELDRREARRGGWYGSPSMV